jgi:nanoRNase/pAp phosphatase (c-di-AMP/oligoRNAs hydrolase)
LRVLKLFAEGYSIDYIINDVLVSDAISTRKTENEILAREIENRIEIIDRMAIVRMNDLGMRSNGYAITAFAGDDCDACMIIHGSLDGSFDNGLDYPVSASFYTNSFLHKNGGLFDLTKLATRFDVDGGGHRDACGCRIKPLENGLPVERRIEQHDIEQNIREWLKIWNARIGDDDDVLM